MADKELFLDVGRGHWISTRCPCTRPQLYLGPRIIFPAPESVAAGGHVQIVAHTQSVVVAVAQLEIYEFAEERGSEVEEGVLHKNQPVPIIISVPGPYVFPEYIINLHQESIVQLLLQDSLDDGYELLSGGESALRIDRVNIPAALERRGDGLPVRAKGEGVGSACGGEAAVPRAHEGAGEYESIPIELHAHVE